MTIEELIEKYKKLLSDVPQKMDEMDAGIATAFVMILEDLQSLQEQEEDSKECTICGGKGYFTYGYLVNPLRENRIDCPNCKRHLPHN